MATDKGRHGAELAPVLGPGLWLSRAAPSAEGTHAPTGWSRSGTAGH